ncbi:MAG: hypothetical protein SH850_26350 [Planctomycetaceae bacterium]|nr:hypothetical protein [Planctomycetaceae bacterium]
MITYQYHCPNNGQTLEVQHGMKERLATWGELCQRAGAELNGTPETAAVERLISGGLMGTVSGGTATSSEAMPSLPMASCCGHPASCRHH